MSTAFAWGKLYLAVAELACTDGMLTDRVRAAYRHLANLNITNLEPESYVRLKALREHYTRSVSCNDEDDGTVTLEPLTTSQAADFAHEIISLYDEAAASVGRDKRGAGNVDTR
jgi:hypothetical protein